MNPPKAGRDGGVWARVFDHALRLLPRWFRDEYGADMERDFRVRLEAHRESDGAWAARRFAVGAILAVAPAVVRLRFTSSGAVPTRRPGAEYAGSTLGDDLRAAVRSLVRAPGWTVSAVTILALGVGGTAAVFSVLHAVLLRPLPYAEEDRLVALWTVNRSQGLRDGSSWENVADWVERAPALEEAAVVIRPEFTTSTLTTFGTPERVHVGLASPDFFSLLGVEALHGRVFGPGDLDRDGALAVIGEGMWEARFGRDPDVLGRTLTLNGSASEIVGVVPAELALPLEETRVWQLIDVRAPEGRSRRGWDAYRVVGRLAPGATLATLQEQLDRISLELEAEHPLVNADKGVEVISLRQEIVGDRLPLLLWTLLASVVLVLLVGGVNVAQLVLSRSVDRRREMAIRAALGATRARVRRQLLLESGLLSTLAGLAGIALAALALRVLVSLIPPDVPLTGDVGIDGAVLLTAFGGAAVLAPLVGLLPALIASKVPAARLLRSGGRGSTGGEGGLRSALVVTEVALAVVLLASAGLLFRSASAIQRVDPGLDARQLLSLQINLSGSAAQESVASVAALVQDVEALPGVSGAGTIGTYFVERIPDQTITVLGAAPRPPDARHPQLTTDMVLPGFFEAVGVPILAGRSLESADLRDDAESVVVNRAWVEAFVPDRDPVGTRFRWSDQVEGPGLQVVGVVGDLRRATLEEASYPQIFLAGVPSRFDLVVRTEGDPTALAAPVRALVQRMDPQAAVSRVGPLWDRYHAAQAPRNFQTLLFGIFAALATLLAAIGLFAILHQTVVARRREIGIRIALGAAPGRVRREIVARGLRLALAGLAVGLALTAALSGVLGRMVYGVPPLDPATLAAVALGVTGLAALASALPASVATRVHPVETLAAE